jgi:uncharacterized protein YbbK (DUF523 family)
MTENDNLLKPELFLVSSCLTGLCTRYDGRIKPDRTCLRRLENKTWIPICPEQLGGLPTPREAADIHGGDGTDVLQGKARVLTKTGLDVTPQFIRGAEQVLEIARSQSVTSILLKARSPSCGVTGTCGVTAALLQKHSFSLEEFG